MMAPEHPSPETANLSPEERRAARLRVERRLLADPGILADRAHDVAETLEPLEEDDR